MSVYENIKYPCNQCESKITLKGNLNQHKKSVHKGNKYPCNQCESKFTVKGNLNQHKMSVHKGFKIEKVFRYVYKLVYLNSLCFGGLISLKT